MAGSPRAAARVRLVARSPAGHPDGARHAVRRSGRRAHPRKVAAQPAAALPADQCGGRRPRGRGAGDDLGDGARADRRSSRRARCGSRRRRCRPTRSDTPSRRTPTRSPSRRPRTSTTRARSSGSGRTAPRVTSTPRTRSPPTGCPCPTRADSPHTGRRTACPLRPTFRPMTTIHHDADADLAVLEGASVAVVGYGNQGRSWALNLRDSGLDVQVCVRADATREQAAADGFTPGTHRGRERRRHRLHPRARRRHPVAPT